MIDPVLERNLSDCTELLEMWRRFHDILASSVKGEGITPDGEAEFLQIKSRIAKLHDSFMVVLQADRNIGQSVLTIVSRAITLQHLARMSVAEVRKMEIEWHQAYLLLQETLGNLEDKREKLANVSEAAFRAEKWRTNFKQRIDRVLKSNTMIGLGIFFGLVFVTVGVQVLGIWDWGNLRNYGVTRTAFYYTYDKGLRYLFNEIPYYRLEWVDLPVIDEEAAAFLPMGYWRWRKEQQSNLDRECEVDVEAALLRQVTGLSADVRSQIEGRREYKELWTTNSEDYICLALFLMDSTGQAREVAQDIRRSLQDTRAGERFGTANRSNILIVVFFSVMNNHRDSRDAFPIFVNRAQDLIY